MDPLLVALISRTAFWCFRKLFTLDRSDDEAAMEIKHRSDETTTEAADNGSQDFLLFHALGSSRIFAYHITFCGLHPHPAVDYLSYSTEMNNPGPSLVASSKATV